MFKKIAFAGLGVAFLASPLLVSADTLSDLQAQIQALLAQVRQLQEQLIQLQTPVLPPPGPGNPWPTTCPTFTRTLGQGTSGDDVTELQAYLGVSQTGYFGPMTAKAVAVFQAEESLSQVGFVGPQTRAAFARRCGWGNQNFSASPTSGQAPLTVTFRTTTSPSTNNGTFTVDFGDGTTGEIKSDPNAPMGVCMEGAGGPCNGYNNLIANHTYPSDGTYNAKLMYQEPFVCNAPPGAACMMVMANPQQVGTVVIRVGAQTTNVAFSALPTSGPAPLTVQFSTSEKSGTIDFGDGTSGQVQQGPLGYCDSVNGCWGGGYGASHTYTANGTYDAKLKRATGQTQSYPPNTIYETIGTATIVVGGTTGNGAPVVTGVDGPASLATGQSGTWTVRASVPNTPNAQLRYSVIWGDEGVLDTLNTFAGIAASPTLQTSASFTHLYARAGTYRPTFTVANDFGRAQTSASVVVGKDTTPLNCPQYMPPLCGANESLVGGGYGWDGCQLAPRCVPNTSTSGTFSASPTSGQAPLAVHFWATVSGGEYKVDFGDGTSGGLSGGWCPPNPAMGAPCSAPGADHTYTSVGTYTAHLLQKSTCAIDTTCWIPVLGTSSVTITVGGSSGGGVSACPAGGIASAFGSCTTYTSPAVYQICPFGASATVSGTCVANTYTSPMLNSCPAGTHLVGGTSIGCIRDTQSSSASANTNLASALTALESAIKAFIANLR